MSVFKGARFERAERAADFQSCALACNPIVPCHQAVSLVNSSAISAAVDRGIGEKKVCASGVDRVGSLEMLILSEFEAFEPRLRACLHASSSSQARYSGAYCVRCMVGCLVSKCKRCNKE